MKAKSFWLIVGFLSEGDGRAAGDLVPDSAAPASDEKYELT
ncbi:hypothetical protein C7S13_3505 [Burkholderia cepacia]|nr:hypothetical protein [Burkholderia cepacia]MDW9243364.1 hypothetical protein [Burkholderia cepacia]